MHGGNLADDEPMAEMNLIPLIDIALTLVIILMVTTTFVKNPGVSLQLPHTVTREGAPENTKDLTVAVTAEGGTYVDGKPISAPDLQARLKDLGMRNHDARVLIKGDQNTAYKNIMAVTDMVRQAKLSKIVFPSLPKSPGEPDAAPPAAH